MTRRGLTLIEVVIAAALLSLLLGASLFVAMTLQRGTNDTLLLVDMERDARRLMADMRRELRQSGWDEDTNMVSSPAENGVATSTLTFRTRTGFGSGQWSQSITYQLVEDGTYSTLEGTPTRYRVERVAGGETIGMARNVAALQFVRSAGSDSVSMILVLMLVDPSTGEPKTVTHSDDVTLLNPRDS